MGGFFFHLGTDCEKGSEKMVRIDIKGTIVMDSEVEFYKYFSIPCVCPKDVKSRLEEANGEDVTIEINSGGGNVFAGNEIYYAIHEYAGKTTTDIVGLAASAATVVACAADVIRAVPGMQYMIHNVSLSGVSGDYRDMDHASILLKSANKAISNVYKIRTGLSHDELLKLMDEETWLDANRAKELGFIDEIIGDTDKEKQSSSMALVLSKESIEKAKNCIESERKQIQIRDKLEYLNVKGKLIERKNRKQ